MNWHDYDEKLIRRGELILDLDFISNYQTELDSMNRGKEGKRKQEQVHRLRNTGEEG